MEKSFYKHRSFSNQFLTKNLRDIDVRILANVLSKNETITKLDLAQNKITGNGVESLSKFIESSKSIVEIDMSKNTICNTGVGKMIGALQIKSNCTED